MKVQFFYVDDGEGIVEKSQFQVSVDGSVGRHGGTAVDLDQPGFQSTVDHDVKTVKLETPFVGDNDFGSGDQGFDDEFLDLKEGLLSFFLSILWNHVQPKLVEEVLPSPFLVVIVCHLLDGDVGEMRGRVVDIVRVVTVMSKTSEPWSVKVDGEGVVGGDQDVNSEVELLVADEERVVDVPLDDVGLGLVGHVGPVADFADVPEEENTLSLASANLR